MSKKRARRWSIADARAVLTEQTASGLSMGAFAEREGIDSWRLYRWRRRLDADAKSSRVAAPRAPAARTIAPKQSPTVIELRTSPRRPDPVEIVLQSGVVVRVPETIDPSVLAGLISALR